MRVQVLVVEDEPLIRLGMVAALEDAGFEVLAAPNADAALAILKAGHPIRLIVTDVDMPGTMDGVKLAHMVRTTWPPIQLIVMSGKVGLGAIELPAGAKFMSKPYQQVQFLSLVHDLLAGGGAVPN